MAFKPVNSDHSVTNAVFQLVFTQPVPNSLIEGMRAHSASWTHDLPAVSAPRSLNVMVENDGASVQDIPGIEFAFMRPDGRAAWAVRAVTNVLMVECSRYTRWHNVFGQARRHISSFAEVCVEAWPDAVIAQIILVMSDDYLWFGDRNKYDLGLLIKPNDLMSAKAFSSQAVWHSNSAWFRSTDTSDTLEALNVASMHSDELSNSKGADAHVSVVHIQDYRRRQTIPISEFVNSFDAVFTNVLEEMHHRNKELLREILVPATSKQIGL